MTRELRRNGRRAPLAIARAIAAALACVACHRSAPAPSNAAAATLTDASGAADASLATLDAAPVDSGTDGGTDGGTDATPTATAAITEDAATAEDAGESGGYVEPTAAELAITSWTSPAAIAQLATSCAWMTGGFPGPDDDRPLACGSGLTLQACAPTRCGPPFVACESTCGRVCDQCAAACTASCTSCQATCKDAACRTDCAKSTAHCRQACVRTRDTCSTAGCNTVNDACEKARQARWDDGGCATECDVARDCTARCAPDADLEDCNQRCAQKAYQRCRESRGEFLEQCLGGL